MACIHSGIDIFTAPYRLEEETVSRIVLYNIRAHFLPFLGDFLHGAISEMMQRFFVRDALEEGMSISAFLHPFKQLLDVSNKEKFALIFQEECI